MTIKEQIFEDMKTAMRAKESARLATIRLLQAAIKQREVDERIELDDAQVIGVIDKMIKQRNDSVAAFEKAGRQDLLAIEVAEIEVLKQYLPARMSEEEVIAAVNAIVAGAAPVGASDMGRIMGLAKKQLSGKAEMGMVSKAVKAALEGR